jgi:membrane-bound ClpP family serine protease
MINRLVAIGFVLLGLAVIAAMVIEALFLVGEWPTGIASWKMVALIGLDAIFAGVLFFLAVVIWRARRKASE